MLLKLLQSSVRHLAGLGEDEDGAVLRGAEGALQLAQQPVPGPEEDQKDHFVITLGIKDLDHKGRN